jgi:hypothetical protein
MALGRAVHRTSSFKDVHNLILRALEYVTWKRHSIDYRRITKLAGSVIYAADEM